MSYIICCCARNEERYIVEWLEHHFSIGFDTIIIYDNNDDALKLPALINTTKFKDRVIIRSVAGQKGFQTRVYTETLHNDNFKWCAFIDVDEFLELKQHRTIAEYLAMFPADVKAVAINWLCYGSNGEKRYRNAPVRHRFPYPHVPIDGRDNENRHIKTIIRKLDNKDNKFPTPHYVDIPIEQYRTNDCSFMDGDEKERSFNRDITYTYAVLHHYVVKSDEEFAERNKGRRTTNGLNIIRQKMREKNKKILDTDELTSQILSDRVKYVRGTENAKRILVRSTLPSNVLGCLKQGKHIVLTGPDKKGLRLNRYLNAAYSNKVASIQWKLDDAAADDRDYDLVIM